MPGYFAFFFILCLSLSLTGKRLIPLVSKPFFKTPRIQDAMSIILWRIITAKPVLGPPVTLAAPDALQ